MSRYINQIIVHCAATPNGNAMFSGKAGAANFQTPIQKIDQWHKARGFKRSLAFRKRQNESLESVGYHYVIYLDGTVVTGRHLEEIGAHVYGNNKNSIGICMLGTDKFTQAQFDSLAKLVGSLLDKYTNKIEVLGHRDTSPDKNNDGLVQPWEWTKTCPGFDVKQYVKNGYKPQAINVLKLDGGNDCY